MDNFEFLGLGVKVPSSDRKSEVYTGYVISKVFIKKALVAESRLDRIGTLIHYQSAITVLEESVGKGLRKQYREELSYIMALMKRALECCRAQTYMLDDERKCILKRQKCSHVPLNGDVKLEIPGGVQLFLVQENKEVVTISKKPTRLQAIVVTNDSRPFDLPRCYIKVGTWVYQLFHSKTEICRCANELYIFPFVGSDTDQPTNYKGFGIVISDRANPFYRHEFERFLDDHSIYTIENTRYPDQEPVINLSKTVRFKHFKEDDDFDEDLTGNFVSKKIDLGAYLVCGGLAKGAEMASSLIRYSSNTLKNNVAPLPEPTHINQRVEKTAELANNLSSAGVQATDFLVDGFTKISKVATTKITPHLKSAAQSAHFSGGQGSSQTINNAIVVARSGAQGLSAVWTGLEEASFVVCRAAQDATVDTVNHRCGAEAARLVSHATSAAMNLGKAVNNVQRIGMKMLVKQVAKDSGKEFLENYVEKSPCTTSCQKLPMP